jgi:3-dehydroquinate dehydratase II
MKHDYSLAYLTVLGLSPVELVDVAARTGYRYVGFRLNRITPRDPSFPLITDRALRTETKARLADSGVEALDVELALLNPDTEPERYYDLLETGAVGFAMRTSRPRGNNRQYSKDPMAKRNVYLLNGPNLNMLGKREPHLYGHTTLAEVEQRCRELATELDFELFCGQSNQESKLIDWIHEARERQAGVVINPAGFSFTSVAVMDSLKIVEQPIIEIHITNIHRRESIYHNSLVSLAATGVICGLGVFGYEVALRAMADQFRAAAAGDRH